MPKDVWEMKAFLYDDYVTKTRNRFLREFLDEEERLLDKALHNAILHKAPVSLIEIGAGTGRTLFSYITKRSILSKLSYLIGIDNAGAMYACMTSKFRHLLDSGIISRKDAEKFLFFHMDAVEMSKYFRNGKIALLELKSRFGENDFVAKLKSHKFDNSKKVVVNLLNTLGVMERQNLPRVLNNMVSAAGIGGEIIVSVFNADSFGEIAPVIYKSIKTITGKFDESAFNCEKKEFRTRTYYSHWFSQEEIEKLVSKAGAKNVIIDQINPINTTLKGFFVSGKT